MSSITRPNGAIARITAPSASRLFPLSDFGDIRRSMDDVLGRWFGETPFTSFTNSTTFQPAVDIWETPEAYVLDATLPGVARDDVELEVTGDTISIKGSRKPRTDDTNVIYHVQNIGFGTFHIAYTLPAHIDAAGVKADYKNGILEVTLPKMETAKTRSIKINVNE